MGLSKIYPRIGADVNTSFLYVAALDGTQLENAYKKTKMRFEITHTKVDIFLKSTETNYENDKR